MKKVWNALTLFVALAMVSVASAQTKTDNRVELPKADKLTVKVVVVIEDPMIDGKRYSTTMGWVDPRQMYSVYEKALEDCSGGVVDYQIVDVIEADKMYTYFGEDKTYVTDKDLKEMFIDDKKWTKIRHHERTSSVHYDYLTMVQAYGFDKMVDKGEVNEVWVYSWPINGMAESQFVGKGGFWLNSVPIEGPNNKLLTVMYCNYERNLGCALESYGHRTESMMKHVYGRWVTCPPAKEFTPGMKLNKWELYTLYDKIAPGHAQIGNIHYPANALGDYDFDNHSPVVSYRGAWKYYPNVVEVDPELVNVDTWKNGETGQIGHMKNFFSHLPNKAGVNPEDGKLNNWWHYLVNYEDAIKLEQKLNKQTKK